MTKTSEIVERCNLLLAKKRLDRTDCVEICSAVKFYFANGRPRLFRTVEAKIRSRFEELLQNMTIEEGIAYTDNFFLLSYNFADDTRLCQTEIHDDICLSYENWLKKQQVNIEFPTTHLEKNHVLFICRHATTAGGYAPGMSVYTFSKALTQIGYKVSILVLGAIDERFRTFVQSCQDVETYQLQQNQLAKIFQGTLSIVKKVKPCVILTEIEFGVPAFLSIKELPVPIIYLSPGYYNLPWYDRIALTDTLSKNPISTYRNKFFEIPTYVDMDILSPPVDINLIENMRQKLGFSKMDLVVGAFARMEKFSPQFLDMLCKMAVQHDRLKILLAGPNDKDRVVRHLRSLIDEGRCVVLGSSNVHILGHLLTFGIDTFPNHSGFTLNELMAKGVPVLTKWSESIDANWEMRIPDLIFQTEDDLIDFVVDSNNQPSSYAKWCQRSKEFISSKERHKEFAQIMVKEITGLTN
jgi:hypothetical protein